MSQKGATDKVKRYLKRLRRRTAVKWSNVRVLDTFNDDKMGVEDVYVSVTSLSYKQAWQLLEHQRESDEKEIAKLSRTAKSDNCHGVELKNLNVLLQREGQREGAVSEIHRTLVLGWAGSGKSMICFKILHDWLNGTGGFERYVAVIYIPGRAVQATSADAKSSKRVLLGLDEKVADDDCEIIQFLTDYSDEVLYILDGGDEITQGDILDFNPALTALLLGHGMFECSSLIITSRPCSAAFQLLTDHDTSFDRMFSLVGFEENQLQELAGRRLSHDAEQFLKELSFPENAQVKAAAKETPLFAAMLIHLFPKRRSIPSSITELYEEMFKKLINRNAQRLSKCHEIRRRKHPPSTSSQTLPNSAAKLFEVAEKLSHLAADSLARQRFTFDLKKILKYCHGNLDAVNCQVGLLTTMTNPDGQTGQSIYTFYHLSWHEYLAAKRLASAGDFPETLKVALVKITCDPHTWLFWKFVAGLVRPSLLPELIVQLSVAMRAHGTTISAKRRRYFLMACLAEQRNVSASSYMQVAISCLFPRGSIDASNYYASQQEVSALAYILNTAEYTHQLDLINSGLSTQNLQTLALPIRNISTVCLNKTSLSGRGLALLSSESQSLPKLGQLSLQECGLTDEDSPGIGAIVSGCTSLHALHLQSNQLKSTGMLMIVCSIPEGSNLEHLGISFNHLASLDGEKAGRALARAKRLQKIHAVGCSLQDDTLIPMLPHLYMLYALQSLILYRNRFSGAVLPAIADLFCLRHLDKSSTSAHGEHANLHVELSGTTIRKSELEAFARNLSPGILDTLTVGLMRRHGGHKTIASLSIEMVWLTSIQEATCQAHDLSDEEAVDAAQALCNSDPPLEKLQLQANLIGDRGAAALANCIPVNTRLTAVDLSDNQISLQGANVFGEVLSQASPDCSLVYLNLGHNPIFHESSAGSECFEALLCSSSLQILALSNTGLADHHFNCLSASTRPQLSSRLHLLDLSNNRIGDAGAKLLAPVASSSNTLQLLSLSGNQITDNGAKVLAATFSTQLPKPSLECVWLGGNNIEEGFLFCDLFVQGAFSVLKMDVGDVLSEYLPGPSVKLYGEQHQQTESAIGFLRVAPALLEAVKNSATILDTRGLLGLAIKALDCLLLSWHAEFSQKKNLERLQTLYRLFSHCWRTAKTGQVGCALACMKLCLADVLFMERHLPEVALTNLLFDVARLNMEIAIRPAMIILARLAKVCTNRGRRDVGDCLEHQAGAISNTVVFQQLSGKL